MLCYPITIGCFDIMGNLGWHSQQVQGYVYGCAARIKDIDIETEKSNDRIFGGEEERKKKMASAASS